MRYLYAAVLACLFPFVIPATFLLSTGAPLSAVIREAPNQVVAGLMAAAPFVMMAAARSRAPALALSIGAGLILTAAPWIYMIVDMLTAEPGTGVNIGLGLVMPVWPLIVFAAMLGLSFVRLKRA